MSECKLLSDGMNRLDPFEFDVVLESLKGCRVDTGQAATTATGPISAAADDEEDPYAFDMFLTLITGVERCGDPDVDGRAVGRGLHSCTFWLNLSAFCGIGVQLGVV